MKYHNGDLYEGEFSNDKMHGRGVFEFESGDIIKSTGQWKEGKKWGSFTDSVRVVVERHIYYENDEVKPDPNVKSESVYDQDTDNEDSPPRKRRNICVTPP